MPAEFTVFRAKVLEIGGETLIFNSLVLHLPRPAGFLVGRDSDQNKIYRERWTVC